jgi:F-type H+-transporting ATPase subunit b
MAKKIFLSLVILTGYAFAAQGGAHESTDIFWRTINFFLFVAILWYYTAKPIKNFFVGRTQKIANELQRVQEKLRETKSAKEKALESLRNSKKLAEEIVETAKKENKLINDSILEQCTADMKILAEHNISLMELDKRKMVREIVSNRLEELLSKEDVGFNKQEMAEIILSKVA